MAPLSHFTPRDLTSWKREVTELLEINYAGCVNHGT